MVVPCRPIAVIEVEQDAKNKKGRERNDRILAVPVASARGEPLHGPKDIAERVREELERFFVVVTGFADKNIEIRGWGDAKAAEKLVRETQLKPKKRRR